MASKIDFDERRYDGELNGVTFSVYADGTIACRRVTDTMRDEMRMYAADAFMSSNKLMRLSCSERNYWSNIRQYDPDHKNLSKEDQLRHKVKGKS